MLVVDDELSLVVEDELEVDELVVDEPQVYDMTSLAVADPYGDGGV